MATFISKNPCKTCGCFLRYTSEANGCVACRKRLNENWKSRNKEHIKQKSHERYIRDKERILEITKIWASKNQRVVKSNSKKWNKLNGAAQCAKRRALKIQATPVWADTNLIHYTYTKAKFMTWFTGIKYDVDHIIPLKGKNVCGLHIETNLQVIPKIDNIRKGNRYD